MNANRVGFGGRAPKDAGVATVFATIATAAFVVVMLLISALFLGILGSATASTPYCAQVCGGTILEPNPGLAGNVTVSTHAYGSSPLSYLNGTTTQMLTAHVDSSWAGGHVQNPYVINPSGIVAPGILQSDKIAGGTWNNTSLWNGLSAAAGQHATGPTLVTVNGVSAIQWTINATHAAAEDSVTDLKTNIPTANWPSANPAFDYWTEVWEVSSSATCASCVAYLSFANASSNGNGQKVTWNAANGGIAPIGAGSSAVSVTPAVGTNSVLWFSASQAQMSSSANLGLNASGPGSTASLNPTIWIHTPLVTPTPTITVTLVGLAFGSAPLTLGATYWGGSLKANMTRQAGVNTVNLSSTASSFSYTSIAGGSYTVAVVQSAQDVGYQTISQSANANGSETLTYVFQYGFPSASALSYGTFKVADVPELQAWQYSAVSFGGAAYTSTYQTKANVGNYTTIVASAVPTTVATWVATITYSPTQWDLISAPPGFFSTNGFQFYWFVLIGAVFTALGLGASGWAIRNQRALRGRRAVQPLPFSGRVRAELRSPRGAAHHSALTAVGLILLVSGVAAVWATSAGANPAEATATFLSALIVASVVAAVSFVIYEAYHISHRHHA